MDFFLAVLVFLGWALLWIGVLAFKLILLYFLFNWIDKLFDKYGD